MDQVSKLQPYSIGTVAANKVPGSDLIEVTTPERTMALDGETSDAAYEYGAKATGSDGQAYEVATYSAGSVSAKWLPLGQPNRMTAPDVRRGETVILYKFGNADQIYWNTLWNDLNFRKLETIVWGISATQDEGAAPSPENMYYLELNSHEGLVHLHTSKANGEPFEYDLQLNTKEGFLKFQDDIGNYLLLNSAERQVRLEVADGSFLEILKKIITLSAVDEMNLLAGKKIVLEASESITETTAVKTTDAPATLIKGNLSTAAGRSGSTGSGVLEGDFRLKGSMTAEKDLIALGLVKADRLEWVTGIEPPYP